MGPGSGDERQLTTDPNALMAENLIDGYWLFVNPILLGQGFPLFKNIDDQERYRDKPKPMRGCACLQLPAAAISAADKFLWHDALDCNDRFM